MMSARQLSLLALATLFFAMPAGAAQNGRTNQPEAPAARTPGLATITFRKIFKSSSPEFVEIKVGRNGASTYDIRQLEDTPRPQPFPVSAALTDRIFSLAASLHDFDGIQLEVRRRVANLGEKTFIYEKDGITHQVSFNYTTNSPANDLLDIFEGLSLEDQYADRLRRTMRYDPLGLNDVLARLDRDIHSRMIPEPKALVPLLNEIASNSSFLDIARQRARLIVASIGPGE